MRNKLSVGLILTAVLMAGGCSSKSEDSYKTALKLMSEGKYTEADEYFSDAVTTHNSDAGFYVDMGNNCIELQKYTVAVECFEHAISLESELEDAYKGLGMVYFEQEKYVDAIEAFSKAIDQVDLEVGPREYDILEYRGACERLLCRYDDALKTYDALIKLGVNKVRQYLYEGRIYLDRNEVEKAGECFDTVLSLKKDTVEIYFTIYKSYVDADYADEGMKYLSKALEVDGNSTEAHLWRGKIYYIMGNNTAALTELAYPYEEQNHEAALYTAFCYEAMGETEKAKETYYTELTRQDDPVMSNHLAVCLSEQGEYNTAWSVVHKAITNFPDCECIQELLWNEIVLYEKMGYYASAYTHLLDYQKNYPQDPLVEQELAFLLMKQS